MFIMAKINRRNVVEIDRNKCNGCGVCVSACHEGAIEIIGGKATLVSDVYCDGLGNCIGKCPQDAIKIISKDAQDFDFAKTNEHLRKIGRNLLKSNPLGIRKNQNKDDNKNDVGRVPHLSTCPGAMVLTFEKVSRPKNERKGKSFSELRQWPVQLSLVSVNAPFFKGADVLICADCVPFAEPDFHDKLLKGKAIVIGCPKLDDIELYAEKIQEIIRTNDIRTVTVAIMEVPCCARLYAVVNEAAEMSGKNVPVTKIVTKIGGR